MGYKHDHVCAKIETEKIRKNRDAKLLGINIDNQLKFDKHTLEIYSKVGSKLSASGRMSKSISFIKQSLNPSFRIVLLHGCSIIALQIIESIDYMNGLCA